MSYEFHFPMYLYVPKMACKGSNRVTNFRCKNVVDSHCMTLFFLKNVNMSLFLDIYMETNG